MMQVFSGSDQSGLDVKVQRNTSTLGSELLTSFSVIILALVIFLWEVLR